MAANDNQIAGSHYAASVQHWDYVIIALLSRYLEGNITKYVTRHRKKNGMQDLQKALHYLEKLSESYNNGLIPNMSFLQHAKLSEIDPSVDFDMDQFVAANDLNANEEVIVRMAAAWATPGDLHQIHRALLDLMQEQSERDRLLEARKAGAAEPGPGYTNQDGDDNYALKV